ATPEIVHCKAILCVAALGLESIQGWEEAEVAPPNGDGAQIWPGRDGDLSAAVPIGSVDPVVDAVVETIHPVLLVPLPKPGENDALFIRSTIPIPVLEIKDIRRASDQHSVSVGQGARGK